MDELHSSHLSPSDHERPERRQPRSAEQARRSAEQDAARHVQDLELTVRELVAALALAAEYREDRSGQHGTRVAQLAADLAQHAGLNGETVERIRLAARLHDVGKAGLPDTLLKRGPLDPDEQERLKRHTALGAQLLGGRSRLLRTAAEIAFAHHEHWNGDGYPSRLRGTDIPVAARIVAITDAWDALTSDRTDRRAPGTAHARSVLSAAAGQQFDPDLTATFLATVRATSPGPPPPVRVQAAPGPPEDQAVTRVRKLNQEAWETRHTDLDASRRSAEAALRIAEQHDDDPGRAAALRTLALADLRRDDHRSALDRLNRAHSLLRQVPDPALERDLSNLSGWLYQRLENSDRATQFLLRSLEISVDLGDSDGQANALLNLGIVALDRLGDSDGAVTYFRQALDLQRRSGNRGAQANTLYNLADALIERREQDAARRAAEDALQAAQESGNVLLALRSRSALARAHALLGSEKAYRRAQTLHDAALQALNDSALDVPEIRCWIELHRAQNLIRLGLHDDARSALERVLREAERGDLLNLQIEVHRALTDLHSGAQHYREALAHASTTLELKETYDRQRSSERTQAMLMQFEVHRAQSEADLYRLRTVELANANALLERADQDRAALLAALQEQQEKLERQVREDALSGLYNRRHAELLLADAYREHQAQRQPFVIAMIDIDHFKRVNDTFGHQTGDEVIREVARLLRESLREGDMVGRYGGEEFVMMLAQTDLSRARQAMERLRVTVQDHRWDALRPGLTVTLSIGAADNAQPSWEKMVGAADRRLYDAKRTRNSVAT